MLRVIWEIFFVLRYQKKISAFLCVLCVYSLCVFAGTKNPTSFDWRITTWEGGEGDERTP